MDDEFSQQVIHHINNKTQRICPMCGEKMKFLADNDNGMYEMALSFTGSAKQIPVYGLACMECDNVQLFGALPIRKMLSKNDDG
jgi:predicted nucleic acid-binding Zn ribbon protein